MRHGEETNFKIGIKSGIHTSNFYKKRQKWSYLLTITKWNAIILFGILAATGFMITEQVGNFGFPPGMRFLGAEMLFSSEFSRNPLVSPGALLNRAIHGFTDGEKDVFGEKARVLGKFRKGIRNFDRFPRNL